MKILWHSVKPTIPTGYGMQTGIVCKALKRAGHDVTISCSSGMVASSELWEEGIRLLPHSSRNAFGNDMIRMHAANLKPDVIITMLDAFVFSSAVWCDLPWFAWVPCDSEPLMCRNIPPVKVAKWRAAMSKWGAEQMMAVGFTDTIAIPGSFDKAEYFPMPGGKKQAREILKDMIGIDIGCRPFFNVVSANVDRPGRKNFPGIMEAWRLYSDIHRDALLYIHTDAEGYYSDGNDLPTMVKLYGINPSSVLFPPTWEYITGSMGQGFLNVIHNASDAHWNMCLGEGFGLPILEAQAAGCPVIVPDFGAAAEIAGPYSIKLPVHRECTVPGAMQGRAEPRAAFDALCTMTYRSMMGQNNHGDIGQFALQYEIQNVMDNHWLPALARIENELRERDKVIVGEIRQLSEDMKIDKRMELP